MAEAKPTSGVLRRSETLIWLIGQPEKAYNETMLPTSREVLKVFFYYHLSLKKTVSESANICTNNILNIWNKARIPTKHSADVVQKLKSLFGEYTLIKKNKNRKNEVQKNREMQFMNMSDNLFDISHMEADSLIKIEEDRVFLRDQRTVRKMKMFSIDKDLTAKEIRKENRRELDNTRIAKECERKITSSVKAIEETETEISDKHLQEDDYEFEIPLYYRNQLQITKHQEQTMHEGSDVVKSMLRSPDVASTIDRLNISDRKFTMLAAAIARANNEDIQLTSLSRSTVRRMRISKRQSTSIAVRQEFLSINKPPLVLHWDGKIMHDSSNLSDGDRTVDRLAVCVTGHDTSKILGIVKIPHGTGKCQANAVFRLLQLWNLQQDIVALCYDTTASNTGQTNGACHIIQQQLGRSVIMLPCRHHIHELIIGGVYSSLFGPSKGPNIQMFEQFKKCWPKINKENFKLMDEKRWTYATLKEMRKESLRYLKDVLRNRNELILRDDYREMIELSVLFLSNASSMTKPTFRQPGAYHMARWMSKVIYCYKIFIFREQLNLSSIEIEKLQEFCIFSSAVYVKAWISSPMVCDAPNNDLQLLKILANYAKINKSLSEVALKKLMNHLNYLGPEIVPFALFSYHIELDEKKKMVNKLKSIPSYWSERKVSLSGTLDFANKTLSDFITPASNSALNSLGIDITFLYKIVPSLWKNLEEYSHAQSMLMGMKCVNDTAERTIALISSYNDSLTKSETEIQNLTQVVEDHRKRVPNEKKGTLASYSLR